LNTTKIFKLWTFAYESEKMKLDLHSHSHYSSDSITKPETIVRKAKELGLTIAITDHNTCDAWPELRELAKKNKIEIIFGEEVWSFELDEKHFAGELIGLFLTEKIKSKFYLDIIDEVHAQGGIISVPHPFDVFRKNFKKLDLIKNEIDLFEVFNARCYRNSFNDLALDYAKKNALKFSAGSDAHTPEEYGNAFAEVAAFSLEEARKKLLKGEVKIFGKNSGLFPHFKTALAKKSLLKDQ